MEDHVCAKDELVMPGSVVKGSLSVRVVIPKLGTNRNDFIWPPRDADSMLGIICGEASPAADLVVKIFVTHREERVPSDSEHRIVDDRPLGRITVLDRKRAASKRYLGRWMLITLSPK